MNQKVSALLNDLEAALRAEGHWSGMPPSPEALASTEPFCIDTLSLVEWLQWIYIPRLRAIIEQRTPLPSGAQVHPYAEEALASMPDKGGKVLEIIALLDAAMA